jgi:hypothetical protein
MQDCIAQWSKGAGVQDLLILGILAGCASVSCLELCFNT